MSTVMMCVDEFTCSHPSVVGLDSELFESQPWLMVMTDAQQARKSLSEYAEITEVWVLSNEQVEPINLAATLKADRPDVRVCLLALEQCGSLFSRAHSAHIDTVFNLLLFVRRYSQAKLAWAADAVQAAQNLEDASDIDEVEDASLASAKERSVGDSSDAQISGRRENRPRMQVPKKTSVLANTQEQNASSREIRISEPHVVSGQNARETVGSTFSSSSSKKAFLMPIVSGSGGSGKSTTSVLSALMCQRAGYRTLLLDYDLQFGDVSALLGVEHALTIDEVLAHPSTAERITPMGDLPAVLAAPARVELAEQVAYRVPELIERLAPSFDIIVANTGDAWDEQHAALLERSDAALFIVDQHVSSLRACKQALELCARCGIATGPFHFVLNRCAKNARFTSIDVSCALKGSSVYELRDGGRDVEDFLSGGAALDLLASNNELCISLVPLLSDLLPQGDERFASVNEVANARKNRGRRRLGRRKRERVQ